MMDEEEEFKIPDGDEMTEEEEEEDPLKMDGFHEVDGFEPEADF